MAPPKQLPKIGSSDHYCFLIKQSPQEVYEKNTCQSKFESFHQTLTEAIEKYLPSTTVQVHSSDKPWINCKIKSCIKKRQKYLARYSKQSPRFN